MLDKLFYRICWAIIWIVVAACVWMEIQIQLEFIEIRKNLRESREIHERIMRRL